MSEEGDRITVLFDAMGYRTLSLAAIADNRVLTVRTGSADRPTDPHHL